MAERLPASRAICSVPFDDAGDVRSRRCRGRASGPVDICRYLLKGCAIQRDRNRWLGSSEHQSGTVDHLREGHETASRSGRPMIAIQTVSVTAASGPARTCRVSARRGCVSTCWPRRGPLAREPGNERATEVAVLFIQVLGTEGVGQLEDLAGIVLQSGGDSE